MPKYLSIDDKISLENAKAKKYLIDVHVVYQNDSATYVSYNNPMSGEVMGTPVTPPLHKSQFDMRVSFTNLMKRIE